MDDQPGARECQARARCVSTSFARAAIGRLRAIRSYGSKSTGVRCDRLGVMARNAPAPRRSKRHDADAGGDPEVLAAKAALRERVWADLDRPGVARFPKPVNRIPNFVGAEAAARRLAETPEWQAARTLKSNPDSPQWPVRTLALEDGKVVYIAVPRLAERDPFFLLDPAHLRDAPRTASSIKGASRSAHTVGVDELEPVDLVVTGCVAVDESGARLGKGGGFSDLELAIAAEAGLVDANTVVVTTVHDLQVLASGTIPTTDHDIRVDVIVTPEQIVRCRRPKGWSLPTIRWDDLTDEKIAAIPLLARLRG
jgi:5-formyltetrahydrofolate cyclo-ligase